MPRLSKIPFTVYEDCEGVSGVSARYRVVSIEKNKKDEVEKTGFSGIKLRRKNNAEQVVMS